MVIKKVKNKECWYMYGQRLAVVEEYMNRLIYLEVKLWKST